MNPKLLELIQNGLKDPKTTVLAMVALCVGGAGKYLQDSMIEPLGSLLVGAAALLVLIIGWISNTKTPPAPALAQPSTTPPPAEGAPPDTTKAP